MMREEPTLSLCMIVKNEEKNLPECLQNVNDIFDQIVVVDTGSEDETAEVARAFGAELHHFQWIDDFSAARNESLKHATGDWIFWLDADDRMEREEAQKLKNLISLEKDAAFYCRVYCYQANGQDTEFLQLRLFPNLPGVKFQGLVHEQVSYSLVEELGIRSQACDVRITHIGYSDKDTLERKARRNIKLLKQQIKRTPERVNVRYHLATHYNALGEVENGIRELEKIIEQTKGEDKYRDTFLICSVILGNCYRKVGKVETALDMYKQALVYEENYGLGYFFLGDLYYKLGKIDKAREQLLKADKFGIKLCLASLPIRDIHYYISYYLGKCHEEKGDLSLAIQEYKKALQIKPESAEVYNRLGCVYLKRGQYEQALIPFEKSLKFSRQSADI